MTALRSDPAKDGDDATSQSRIPVSWEWVQLGHLVADTPNAITDGPFGSNLKTEHYTNEGPRVLRLQNIGDGRFLDYRAYIRPDHFAKLTRHHVFPGDLVIAALGEVLPRACLVPDALGPALVKADCIRFAPDLRLTNPSYACLALNSPVVRRATAKVVHGVGRPRLNLSEIKQVSIPLAPLQEQSRIVAGVESHISRLDAAVAALRKVKANLKNYRASVLKAACEGRLVPTEAELASKERRTFESGDALLTRVLGNRRSEGAVDGATSASLPTGWARGTLGLFSNRITSGSRDWSRYYGKGTGTFILAQNVRSGRLDLSSRQSVAAPADDSSTDRSRVRAADLLVTIVGANTGDTCRVLAPLTDHFVCQSVALIRPAIESTSAFIELFLRSPEHGQRQFRGFTYGQGRPHLSFQQLHATIIHLPPFAEQQRIVEEVDRRLSVVDRLEATVEKNLARCARLRQSILKVAFEGRLVPQDPNDEPASALLDRIRSEREKAAQAASPRGWPRGAFPSRLSAARTSRREAR